MLGEIIHKLGFEPGFYGIILIFKLLENNFSKKKKKMFSL